MPRTAPGRWALLIPGVVCVALALAMGIPLLPWVPAADAWTALEEARPLTEEHERVELLLDGRSLELALAEGALRREDGSALRAADLSVRFNEAGRLRALRMAIFAALAAAGVVLLAVSMMLPTTASGSRRNE